MSEYIFEISASIKAGSAWLAAAADLQHVKCEREKQTFIISLIRHLSTVTQYYSLDDILDTTFSSSPLAKVKCTQFTFFKVGSYHRN